MKLEVTPTGQSCGARVAGVDLTRPLSPETVAQLRAAWLEHHVLVFPEQAMSDDDLERFTLYFGPFGDDPYIAPIPGREHIIAVERRADETSTIFADTFHSDWSFQEHPPQGTCLFGITIPPRGGNTFYSNQHLALEAMPAEMRERFEAKTAIHSAAAGYAPDGRLGDDDVALRSMDIRPSADAYATWTHPLVRPHPETGRLGFHGTFGYITGFEGIPHEEGTAMLLELYQWQSREEFLYEHVWQADMLVMWDNRSVLHRATGGYEGHDRLLHRTTIGSA